MQNINKFTYRKLSDYHNIVSSDLINQLTKISKNLQGKKIYEINSTSKGGGVAELLYAQMPLYKDLGLDINWLVLDPDERFFTITKNIHNCLQGKCALPNELDFDYYNNHLASIAKDIPQDGDLYVLHDPQTIGLAPLLPSNKLIWRCHIDTTMANPQVLSWAQSYYKYFDKLIFSQQDYAVGAEENKVAIVYPSIDPLSDKNKSLTGVEIDSQLNKNNIDNNIPYLLQVSRFDKFKNPLGVIDIFEHAHKLVPNLNCILAGDYSTDDPEGEPYFKLVKSKAEKFGSKIQTIVNVDDTTINALQRSATLIIQNSTEEGFGLTITEALWKEKMVFTNPVGGIKSQIVDGKTGFYLDSNTSNAAKQIAQVISNSQDYKQIGINARKMVANKFITPIMLRDYLSKYNDIIAD